jgi:GNAT superfamily N-acetyltransferase
MPVPDYKLRRVVESDRPLLLQIYASTRADELAPLDWSDAEKARFVESQFEAQATHYANVYPDGEFCVIESPGATPLGRLYLHRGRSDLRIIDIALLAEHRGRGLGNRILADVLDEAASTGKTVSIHVEIFNPAQRLYERLGFAPVETQGLYHLMRWTPLPYPEVCHG